MTSSSKSTSSSSRKSQENTTNSSVPSAFELYNHTIRVIKKPAPAKKDDEYGHANFETNEIILKTGKLPQSVEEHTYYHELVHFLLLYAGRPDLTKDEVLVDTLGGLLAQYIATKR